MRAAKQPNATKRKSATVVATRDQLISAAMVAFAKHGFRGASVRDIGESVGISFPLVTYHFGNKENLWLAVVERALTEIVQLGQSFEINEEDDPAKQMKSYFTMVLQDSTRHPDRRRILAQISARNDKATLTVLGPLLQQFQEGSTKRIQQLLDMGFRTDLGAREIQMVLRGLLAANAGAPQGARILYGFKSDKALVGFQAELLMKLITRQ